MQSQKKHNIIFTNRDGKPSRFLVDLNAKILPDKNDKKAEKKGFFSFFKKQKPSDENSKTEPEIKYSTVEDNFDFDEYASNFTKLPKNLKTPDWYTKHEDKLSRLAFWPFIKFIFKFPVFSIGIIFKTSFKIGWIALFVFKFSFLLIKYLFKPFLKLAKTSKSKLNEDDLLKNVDEIATETKKTSQKHFNFSFLKNKFSSKNHHFIKPPKDKKAFLKIKANKFKIVPKPIFTFIVIIIILILPIKIFTYYEDLKGIKGRVLGASEDALSNIKGAADSISELKFNEAGNNFVKAGDNFYKAKQEISNISGLITVLSSILPLDDLKLAKNGQLMLDAGVLSSKMGEHMTMALASLNTEDFTLKNFINDLHYNCVEASKYANELKVIVDKIDPEYLPEEYRDKFLQIENKADLVIGSLGELAGFLDEIKIFLGMDSDKRYLLVFQNNTEMRASGGFIGSYALVDFRNGQIKKIDIPGGGSYDTEGGLFERIIAPEPLHLVNPLWHFWDANWWPDWPTTARKLEWFLERSNGPTVDGVISFTPTVLERMLEIIGPIDMTEKYDVVITADNFWSVTQEIVERKETPPMLPDNLDIASTSESLSTTTEEIKNEPKKIIGDLASKLIEELPAKLNKETMLALAGILENSLKEKHILLYFGDEDLENKAKEFGWDGAMMDSKWDYLMVVNTNIAGQKTDREIIEEINHTAQISPDGTIINTVTIKRTHTGKKGDIFTGVRNVNWMRVYVPEGSKLIEASGFENPDEKYFEDPDPSWKEDPDVLAWEGEATTDIKSGTKIYTENNKTVFANWTMLDPGKTITIILKYQLPFQIIKQQSSSIGDKLENFLNPTQKQITPYALLVQKQPGSIGSSFSSVLKISDNFKNIWQYPSNENLNPSGWQINDKLETDKYFATLLEIN